MKTERINYNKFKIHHKKNPQVWLVFTVIVQQAINAGVKAWSVKGVFEVIRWQTTITKELEEIIIISHTGEKIKYRLSNTHTAYYARLYNAAFNSNLFKEHRLQEPEPEYITEILLVTQPGHPYYIG